MFDIFKKLIWFNKVLFVGIFVLLVITGLQYVVFDNYLYKNVSTITNEHEKGLRTIFKEIPSDLVETKESQGDPRVRHFSYITQSEYEQASENLLVGYLPDYYCFQKQENHPLRDFEKELLSLIEEKCTKAGLSESAPVRQEITAIINKAAVYSKDMSGKEDAIRESLLYKTFSFIELNLYYKLLDSYSYGRGSYVFEIVITTLIIITIFEALAFITRRKK